MAGRIRLGKNGRVDGVSYYDAEGREHLQKAKAIIVAGYAIETPRLLLNSACAGHENGLANSSDTVGRYLMVRRRIAGISLRQRSFSVIRATLRLKATSSKSPIKSALS
jgi:choline dehydrogenase-like flavoprotein